MPIVDYKFHPDGTLPTGNEVFVFGSNLGGYHGKGAALVAKEKFGAQYKQGIGYMRDPKTGAACYAIPTKDQRILTLPLDVIRQHIDNFINFASEHPELQFFMTRVGCVLAGYSDADIAPLFQGATSNIIFPGQWAEYIQPECRRTLKG